MLVMLAACSTPQPPKITYACPDGYEFNVTYANTDGREFAVFEDTTGSTRMPRVVAASGAKFTNGVTTFWSKGEEAMVIVHGAPGHRDCRLT